MTAKKQILLFAVGPCLLMGYFFASEIFYHYTISPRGMTSVSDFYNRFGRPQLIHEVPRDGRRYYELRGRFQSWWAIALYSEPPAYIFDEQGHFVSWCHDPGDQPRHREAWPIRGTERVDNAAF